MLPRLMDHFYVGMSLDQVCQLLGPATGKQECELDSWNRMYYWVSDGSGLRFPFAESFQNLWLEVRFDSSGMLVEWSTFLEN